MKNIFFRCFVGISLSFLPMGLTANIDAPKAVSAPSANAVLAQERRHFPTANPLNNFIALKKLVFASLKKVKNGAKYKNTEGGDDEVKTQKDARRRRIFAIIAAVIIGVALVYFLQGSIWLSVVTLGIFGYFINRNKINDWERRRYERMQQPDVVEETTPETEGETAAEKQKRVRSELPLSHVANKWTRRAINRFLIGIVGFVVGIVALILAAASGGAFPTFAVLILSVGYLFSLVGFVNAIQAISAKEPQKDWAWLVVILGLPVVLTLFSLLLVLATV
jgi:uncharacterized membrane protein HdeD (DUF308 family)